MLSLYVHIPFCVRKCAYCDFYSVEQSDSVPRFLRALTAEIETRAQEWNNLPVDTVFFGGGTPSMLPPDGLRDILTLLGRVFTIQPEAEITVEVNPGTLSDRQAGEYMSMGVNRLSIGVQSFDPDELRFLDRIHTAEDAEACFVAARRAGIPSVSIDLIFALPGQDPDRWRPTLERALALRPDHVSAYSLIIEDGTPLARRVRAGLVSPPDPETGAELYEMTMATLARHGYEHYEVSNYALAGHRSRHNLRYWSHGPYCGFGPSAHSFRPSVSGVSLRAWNVSALLPYCETLEKGSLPAGGEEAVTREQLVHERIFLGLRSDGLDLERLRRELGFSFGLSAQSALSELEAEGFLQMESGVIRLTDRGYAVCDEIAVRLTVP